MGYAGLGLVRLYFYAETVYAAMASSCLSGRNSSTKIVAIDNCMSPTVKRFGSLTSVRADGQFLLLTLKIKKFLQHVQSVYRQRGRVSSSALHGQCDREFEPYHDYVSVHSEKVLHTAISSPVIEMHCVSRSGKDKQCDKNTLLCTQIGKENIILQGNNGFVSWGSKLHVMTTCDLLFPLKANF